jgi:hypothetical protein
MGEILQALKEQTSCIGKQKQTFIEKSRKQIAAFIIVCNAEGPIKEKR